MTRSAEPEYRPADANRRIPARPPGESGSENSTDPSIGGGPDAPVAEMKPAVAPGIAGEVAVALAGLADRPVEEHPGVYEALHRHLGDTLSSVDHV